MHKSEPHHIEALGELASSVAHDLNNLLFVIATHAESVREIPGVTPAMVQEIEIVVQTCKKAGVLTRRLLMVASDARGMARRVCMNDVVDDVLSTVQRVLTRSIDVHFHRGEDLDPVVVDPVQIEQVITNLFTNARDAMPEGGALTIETANVAEANSHWERCPDLRHGAWTRLTVRDTGHGMHPEIAEQAVEPFFTTKGGSRTGNGLGLSIVHRIVRRHGGLLHIETEPGVGTAVHIFLPSATVI